MKKILFIEDEEALQKTFGDVLKKEDYKVINALNGEIGIRMAKTENPDLILLDIMLPGIDGFEVLRELKSNPNTKNIPVIILTNLEKPNDVEKALSLGATTFLVKTNYGLEDLVEKIKKNLQDN